MAEAKGIFNALSRREAIKQLIPWKKTPTTNMLEGDFREGRRRTRPMDFFPGEGSAQRIFYGVANGIYQNGHHLPTYNFSRNLNMTLA